MPRSGITENFTDASCIYLRFHGPQGDYRGTYSQAFLQQKATHICNWAGKGKEVYVYFNNTIGNAFNNARTLMDMIQEVPL